MAISKKTRSVSSIQLALIGGACITGIFAAIGYPFVLCCAAITITDCHDEIECAVKEAQVMELWLIYGIIMLGVFIGFSYLIYRKGLADSALKPKENFIEGTLE